MVPLFYHVSQFSPCVLIWPIRSLCLGPLANLIHSVRIAFKYEHDNPFSFLFLKTYKDALILFFFKLDLFKNILKLQFN